MVADLEVDKVADMEMDMVADMFWPEAYLASKLCEFILKFLDSSEALVFIGV